MPRKTKEQIEKLEETIKKVVPFGKKSKTKKAESETSKSESINEEPIKDKKSKNKKVESKTSKLEPIKEEPIKNKKNKNKKVESETSKSIKEEPIKDKKNKNKNKDIKPESIQNNKTQTKTPKSKVKNLKTKTKLSDSLKLSEDELNGLKETIKVIEETPVIKKAEENIKNLDDEFAKNIENDIKKVTKNIKIDENISERTKNVEKNITKKIQDLGKKQILNKNKNNKKNTSNKKASNKKILDKSLSNNQTSNKKFLTISNKIALPKKFTSKNEMLAKILPNSKTKKKNAPKFMTEYYDLPPKYNKTVVKLLAQTPKTLFIYWEISDEDIKKYKEQFGENFFETTRPVLIVHNDTLNYSFEVEINDFANSWYLHVNDSKSDYRIELGRRPIRKEGKLNTDYIYITSSNEIESPNDHILFDNSQKMIYFRNVKTNQVSGKSIANLTFIRNMGKIYNIYDLYQKMYAELYKDEGNIEKISNPSSHTSSQFK